MVFRKSAAHEDRPCCGRKTGERTAHVAARRGFSLVELIVVMVIIGLLASLVVFRTRSFLINSKQNAAKAEISRLVQAIEVFYSAYGRYPTTEEGLEILAQPSDKFPDGLINKPPLDPWRRPYVYNNPGRNSAFEVICLGADGREGGTGADKDISNDDVADEAR